MAPIADVPGNIDLSRDASPAFNNTLIPRPRQPFVAEAPPTLPTPISARSSSSRGTSPLLPMVESQTPAPKFGFSVMGDLDPGHAAIPTPTGDTKMIGATAAKQSGSMAPMVAGSVEEALVKNLRDLGHLSPEAIAPTSKLGKAAFAVGGMAAHPVATAEGIATAPFEAAATLGKFASQSLDQKTDRYRGPTADDPLRQAPPEISRKDAAFAAAQLLTLGVSAKALPMLDAIFGAKMATATITAIDAGESPTKALLAGYAKHVAAHAVAGSAVGAAFSKDDPEMGAILGAALAGAHAATELPAVRRATSPVMDADNVLPRASGASSAQPTVRVVGTPPEPVGTDYTVGDTKQPIAATHQPIPGTTGPREYVPESSSQHATEEQMVTRNIARGLKTAHPDAIAHAAPEMAARVPAGAVLVPLPDHRGSTAANEELAWAMAEHGDFIVANALGRNAQVASSQELRQKGKPGLTVDEHQASMVATPSAEDELPKDKPIVFVDNVETTGATAEAARRVLKVPDAQLVTYAKAPIPAGELPAREQSVSTKQKSSEAAPVSTSSTSNVVEKPEAPGSAVASAATKPPPPTKAEQATVEADIRRRADFFGHDADAAVQLYRDELAGKLVPKQAPSATLPAGETASETAAKPTAADESSAPAAVGSRDAAGTADVEQAGGGHVPAAAARAEGTRDAPSDAEAKPDAESSAEPPATGASPAAVERSGEGSTVETAPAHEAVGSGAAGDLAQRSHVPGPIGSSTQVHFSDGSKLHARYRVIEASDLQPSHNPASFAHNPSYPEGIQGREYAGSRGRAAREHVIAETGKLDNRVLDTGSGVTDGPPLITPHGLAIAGNQRAMMLRRAQSMAPEKAKALRTELEQRAPSFGLKPEHVASMKHPVLVREIADPSIDTNDVPTLSRLNQLSDQTPTKAKDVLSAALGRAKQMKVASGALEHFTETVGDETIREYLGTAAGTQFVRKLFEDGVFSPQERGAIIDQKGVTETGKDAIDAALRVAAIGDPDVIHRAPPAIMRKLESALPAIIRANTTADYALTSDLQAALDLLSRVEAMKADMMGRGEKVGQFGLADYLEQQDIFGNDVPPSTVEFAAFLERTPKPQITPALREYARQAAAAHEASQSEDIFGSQPPTPVETKQRLTTPRSVGERSPRYSDQAGFFGNEPSTPAKQESMFGEKDGTVASRDLASTERAARTELDGLRQRARLETDPAKSSRMAQRIALLTRLVDRGMAISPEELAARARGEAVDQGQNVPGQQSLFERRRQSMLDQLSLFSIEHDGKNVTRESLPPESDAQTAPQFKDVQRIVDAVRDLGLPTFGDRAAQIKAAANMHMIDPVGRLIQSGQDVARLMSAFRHPSMEILSAFVLNDDDRIVGHSARTSGALNYSAIPDGWADEIKAIADANGGTRVILGHNHPSGDPLPSTDDLAVTVQLEGQFMQRGLELDGHMVIDHDTAAWITTGPVARQISVVTLKINRPAPATWTTAPEGGYPRAQSPGHIAGLFQSVSDAQAISIVHLDTQRQIVGIEGRASEAASSIHQWLPQSIRGSSAEGVVIVAPPEVAKDIAERVSKAQSPNFVDPKDEWSYPVLDVIGIQPSITGRLTVPPRYTSHAEQGLIQARDVNPPADFNKHTVRLTGSEPASVQVSRARGDRVGEEGRGYEATGETRRISQKQRVGGDDEPLDATPGQSDHFLSPQSERGSMSEFHGKWSRIANSVHPGAVLRVRGDRLHFADYDADGRRVGQGEDRFTEPTGDELAQWDDEAHELARRLRGAPAGDVFIRWGNVPKGGVSKNHATGKPEAGLSTLSAHYDPAADRFRYDDDDVVTDAHISHMMAGSPVHLVTGDVVGRGSDGEPLLKNVRTIGRLDYDEHGFSLSDKPPPIVREPQSLFGSEPDESEEPTTGIKNAVSAETRDELGLGDRARPEPRTQDEMYAAGKATAAADPTAVPRLLNALRADPEKIVGTKVEAGLLLKHRVDLENRLNDLLRAKDEAIEANDAPAEQIARAQLAVHREAIREFVQLAERTGTATGRALAARKMMSTLDYSLSSMEANAEAAKGSSLTEQELQRVRTLHDELQVKLAAAEQDVVNARERAATAEADLEHARQRLEVAGPIADRITARLDSAADKAMARIRARGLRAMAGMDPEELADHAIIGAAQLAKGVRQFAEWSKAMIDKMGSGVVPHLDEIFQASSKRLAEEIDREAPAPAKPKPANAFSPKLRAPSDLRAKMKLRVKRDGFEVNDLRPYLRRLALEHIRNGVTGREAVLDALHADVQAVIPDVSRTEVRDVLSGYGDFKPLDKAADKTRLREIQAESQKLAQLEALQRKQAPLASGFERQAPSDEARRLTAQVNAAKKAAGIGVDQTGRLKSALASAKTRVRNQIKDLQTEIDTGQRIVRGKATLIGDAELTTLKSQLTELRKTESEVFGKHVMTDEQKLAMATAAAKRLADSWQERLDNARKGVFGTAARTAKLGSNPTLDALRAKAKAAREEYAELKALDPAQRAEAEAKANQQYRARLADREAELLDRMARADYGTPPVRPGTRLDAESLRRKAEVEAVKQKYQEQLHAYEKANRSGLEKARDRWAAWVRAGALSWPTVIGKLTSVAASRMVTTPMTDVVALGIAKALPRLSAGAPRYGTSSARVALRAEAAGQTAMWTEGIKGVGRRLKNRRTDLELTHGKEKLPPSLFDYLGQLHGVLKEPVKQAEYARALYRRTDQAIRNGENTTDPITQLRLSNEAYLDAQSAISMNDSPFVSRYQRFVRSLEERQKETGKPSPVLQVLATAMKTEMPIVKVPVNIIKEVSEVLGGSLVGAARAAWEYHKGIEDLEPVERDTIIRLMAKGSIGLAIMALGFFKAHQIGGFYQPGETRQPDDVKAGQIRVGSRTIPSYLLHNPFLWAAQFGATIRRVADSRISKKERDPKGFGAGVLAAGVGLTREIPFAREVLNDADMLDPKKTGDLLEKKVASVLVPGLIQWVAKQADDSIPRKPVGLVQHIEANVPKLRELVPQQDDRTRLRHIRMERRAQPPPP